MTQAVSAQSFFNRVMAGHSANPIVSGYTPGVGDYVILAGQSNCVSVADYSGVPISDTIDIVPVPNIRLSTNNTTFSFEALFPGGNQSFQGTGDFGPDLYLGDTISKLATSTFYIAKQCRGGTFLADTTLTDWNTESLAEYFDELKERIDSAESKIAVAEGSANCIGLIWIQGEADAGNIGHSLNYQSNLENLIDSVRTYVGNSALPVVIGELLGPNLTYRDNVRLAQHNIAKTNISKNGRIWTDAGTRSNTILIDTDYFTRQDDVHYDPDSQVALGRLLYTALSTLINP